MYQQQGCLSREKCAAGHYELDLVLPHHRAAAQRLIDAAAAEGEQQTWRNLVWEALQVPSSAGPPEVWGGTIPTRYEPHTDTQRLSMFDWHCKRPML